MLALVFWDAKRILFVDYFQTGEIISSDYYCNLPNQLDAKTSEVRPTLKKKKNTFYEDNESVPTV